MTLAQAKALASDLVDAGSEVEIRQKSATVWEVFATRRNNPASASTVATLASNNGVSAFVDRARFI